MKINYSAFCLIVQIIPQKNYPHINQQLLKEFKIFKLVEGKFNLTFTLKKKKTKWSKALIQ